MGGLIVWKHRTNIARLRAGTENRFGSGGGAQPPAAGARPPRWRAYDDPMKSANRPLAFVFVAFALTMLVVAVVRVSSPPERVKWRDDFDAAQAEARSSGKPMLAYFTAEWCPPCHELKSTTWADAGVEQALAAYVPVRIDVDVNTDVAMRYGPRAMPTYA